MRWTEIIKVYIGKSMRNALNHQLESIVKDLDVAKKRVRVKLYDSMQSDELSIHLIWEQGESKCWGSEIGISLTQKLNEFGLVSHSIWIERR
jgi:hypothetical protein